MFLLVIGLGLVFVSCGGLLFCCVVYFFDILVLLHLFELSLGLFGLCCCWFVFCFVGYCFVT